MSWLNGLIEVGKGSVVGAESIMRWQDPDPHPVATVAVSTGWGAVGEWEFVLSDSKHHTFLLFSFKLTKYIIQESNQMNSQMVLYWQISIKH